MIEITEEDLELFEYLRKADFPQQALNQVHARGKWGGYSEGMICAYIALHTGQLKSCPRLHSYVNMENLSQELRDKNGL